MRNGGKGGKEWKRSRKGCDGESKGEKDLKLGMIDGCVGGSEGGKIRRVKER